MSKRMAKNALLLLMFLIVLVGCSDKNSDKEGNNNDDQASEVQAGGEMNIAYAAQPPTLDPHMTTAVATSDMMKGVYETLIAVDSNYEFQPMLADSYDLSDDGKVITFKLREGVKFHNGEEMLAEDVIASMERWAEKSSRGIEQFGDAVFEADGDYTVIITLPQPLSTTLSALTGTVGSYPAIMPKEVIDSATETGVTEYIGTGPFQFNEWKADSYLHLTKFDDYQSRTEEADGLAGKKEALVDDVYFHFVSDSSTRIAGIMSGEYDMIHNVPYDSAPQLDQADNVETHVVPGGTLVLLMNKKAGLFTDVKAREAVETALSMEEVLQSGFSNEEYYTLNHNLVMPHLEGLFYSDVRKDRYNLNDPEKAKQILADAGYEGEEITIITTRDYEEQYNASVVVQERLEQIGLKVNLEVYDWPTLLEKREDENNYDINIMGLGPQPEPTSYLFLTKGPQSGWLDSEEFDQLVDDFRHQPSLADTKDAYAAIQQWNADNIPFIKLGDYNRLVATGSNVKNFQFLDGFITWNISIDR